MHLSHLLKIGKHISGPSLNQANSNQNAADRKKNRVQMTRNFTETTKIYAAKQYRLIDDG